MSLHDTMELEVTIVGALIDQPQHLPTFLERIDSTYLSVKVCYIVYALAELITDGDPISVQTVVEKMRVRGELSRAGGGVTVFDVWQRGHDTSFDLAGEIDLLGQRYMLREASEVGTRLNQAVASMTADEWLAFGRGEMDRIEAITAGVQPAVMTYLRDELVGDDVSVQWCIPGLLPRGTATMLTAEEGVGKSTVLRQMALAAMCGFDPFTPRVGITYRPQRVLLIDCEVTHNQFTRSLRALWSYARPYAPEADTTLMVVESHQGGLNFSDSHDQGWLRRLVRDHRAELVVVGPVYRFTDADLNTEEGVRTWQRGFEPLLANGATILTEHHSPNESQNHQRSLRPIGSSAMRRWFAQGIALRSRACASHEDKFCTICQRTAMVESWRGSRDEEARWPHYLTGAHQQVWWERDEYREVEGSSPA